MGTPDTVCICLCVYKLSTSGVATVSGGAKARGTDLVTKFVPSFYSPAGRPNRLVAEPILAAILPSGQRFFELTSWDNICKKYSRIV